MLIKDYLPCLQLQPYIKRIFIINDSGAFNGLSLRTITEGSTEMLFNLADPCIFSNPLRKKEVPLDIHLCGQFIEHHTVKLKGNTHVLCVEFKSGGIYSIFGIPQVEFQSKQIALRDIYPSLYAEVTGQLFEAENDAIRVEIVEKLLVKQLNKQKRIFLSLSGSLEYWQNYPGKIDIKNIISHYNVSLRTLDRKFNTEVGITPKQYLDILKLNSIHQYIQHVRTIEWTNMAYLFGFTDQAHLIHYFKRTTGLAPEGFLKSMVEGVSYAGKITLVLNS